MHHKNPWGIQLLFLVIIITQLSISESFGREINLNLTEEEILWIEEHPVVRLGPDPYFPPIESFDEYGSYIGMAADYIEVIENIIPIQFEIVKLPNWEKVLEQFRSRKIDMLGAAAENDSRSEYMLFTQPFIQYQTVIVVKKGDTNKLTLDDLEGKKVGVASGYITHDYLKLHYPGYDLYPVDSIQKGIELVSFGEVDVFVGFITTIIYAIEEGGYSNLSLAGKTDLNSPLAFGVRRDWPELQSILNKALAVITDEQKKSIHDNWVHIESERLISNRKFQIYALFIITGIVLVISFILIWNQSLKKKVLMKTSELQNELKQREAAEKSLKISENKYRSLVDNFPGIVYRSQLDKEMTLIYISNYIFNISGLTPSDFIERNIDVFKSIIHPDDRISVEETIDNSLFLKEPFEIIYRINHSDGSIRWVQERGQPIYSNTGELVFIDGFILDITDLRSVEEQLIQTQKMETVGTLAGGIAHDFNNILGGITSTVSLMEYTIEKKQTIEPEKLQEYIAILKQSGIRATGVVKNLLYLSRKHEMSLSTVNLNNVIKDVIKVCQYSFDKSIRLEPHYTAAPANVFADSLQLEQVILNLCVNAEHAMTIMKKDQQKWGGTLSIEIEFIENIQDFVLNIPDDQHMQFWCIKVKDEGIGISPDEKNEIFNPFYTTKEHGFGVGLGLSMSYNIIKSLKGYIELKSTPWEGTVFSVFLPFKDESKKREIQSDHSILRKGIGRVLIVEDERILGIAAEEMLQTCGYEVTLVINGIEALEYLKNHAEETDLVFLDMLMPEMSGKEIMMILKETYPDLKVLLTSGYRQDSRVLEVIDLGVKEFLQKPYTLKSLSEAVDRVINQA
ncbi:MULTISPECIES: transporter substrate-binding domain-containing protein [unclassified Oceanispirochaeta]|uniref:response regulator n=1 Tax=unclassified Oceanispirochaeta TaxID=2635722 RepID=UPI000E09D4B8|nr:MULTISPECIES: transporter substrate-binding domain-containing protein [unclassified Oceanispirochaeta]MBF9015907.1 transporter substrate-binding domain-containing protein [Oceanispirochaeta sp. M2]NPD72370.1 transporter substrate-binding domain-containing protein [Oceanispirochaeta sp. M1]RDG32141.1 response regulator [Oceanispirochaeta sp. M1]